MTFETAFDKTLTGNSDTWGGATLVQLIPASSLGGAADKLKLTLQGATLAPTGVVAAYVGHRGAGDSYDFSSTPVAITVGSAGAFELAQSGSAVTDDIIFPYNGTSDLLVAFAFTTNTAKDDIRTLFSGNGCSYWYKYGGNDAATVNKTGYTAAGSNPNALAIISKVEVERPAPPAPTPPPTPEPEPVSWKIAHGAVVRPCELLVNMPVVNYTTEQPWVRLGHLQVDVLPGDVLDIDAVFEVTNELSYWVEITGCLVLDGSSTGTSDIDNIPHYYSPATSTGAQLMTPVIGENMGSRSTEHHHIMRLSKNFKVPAGVTGTKYIAILAYAGGDSVTVPGQTVQLEPSSVDISYVRFRPVFS